MIDRQSISTDPKNIKMERLTGEATAQGSSVIGHRIRNLTATGTTTGNYIFEIPNNWDNTINPKVFFKGFTDGTDTSESYRFEIGGEYKAEGEAIENIEDQTVTWTESAPDGANIWLKTAEQELDKTLIAGKNHINILAKRLGGDLEDGRTGSFRLFSVGIIFARNTLSVEVP